MLEYFDAFPVGLTATPGNHTLGLFQRNVVSEYPFERFVADGVTVDFEVWRVRTQVGGNGGTGGDQQRCRARWRRRPRSIRGARRSPRDGARMTMDKIVKADATAEGDAQPTPLPISCYAVIEADSGLVLNIIEAAQSFLIEGATLVLDDGSAVIRGSWDGAAFRPPIPEPEPVPATISFRQLILGLLDSGFITTEQRSPRESAGRQCPKRSAPIRCSRR